MFLKRSHHLPLIFCGFDVLRQKLEFQHVFHLTKVWGKYLMWWQLSNPQLSPQRSVLTSVNVHLTGQWICCYTRCVIMCQVGFLYFLCKLFNFAFFLGLQQSWSCQKRLESTGVLVGFLCVRSRRMNWYECTVLALSLVLCQGNMLTLFFFFFQSFVQL